MVYCYFNPRQVVFTFGDPDPIYSMVLGGVPPVAVRVIQLPPAVNLSVNGRPSLYVCPAMSRPLIQSVPRLSPLLG